MKTIKKLNRVLIPFVVLSLLGFGIIQLGDDPILANLRKLVANYDKNVPFEKVYLHIDRPFYKPGDNIWFKVYLTNANNAPSKKSDVVYVELINPKGTVEKTLSLQAIQGTCFGDFALDESCAGGLYKIKAYTNWMHNFGNDYVFEKEIQVQKVVYSRLLTKLDFKRESFAPGDTVKAELTLESLENIPLTFKNVSIDISLGGSKFNSFDATTNNKGKVLLAFHLPTNLTTNDGLVNIKIQHEGNVEAISRAIPIVLNRISMQFFPEGGYLVEKIPCKVAFKALDEFGKPADVEGFVTDEAGRVVTSLVSFHQGMGAFDLTPVRGNHYYAHISKPNISEKFQLPDAMPKGYVLKIEKSGNEKCAAQIYSPMAEKMELVVQSGKTVCYSKTLDVTAGLNQLEFSPAKFPVGIGMVTLFDHSGVPRCERLVFFNYHKQLSISLQFDKKKYLPREKVNLKIRTLDEDSIPVPANLSLSVVNDQLFTFADDRQHNIQSWLLVGSDVKGKIEKPEFYFNKEEPKAEKALDYLLLTQGWRRYKWDDVLAQNYTSAFQSQKIGCISGQVFDISSGKPVKAEVTILELDNRKRVLKVNTGEDGKFRFLDVDANATIQVLARSNEVSASNLTIMADELNGSPEAKTGNQELKGFQIIPEMIKEKAQENKNTAAKQKVRGNGALNEQVKPAPVENGMVLQEDVQKLEEVVVIGYGVQKKMAICGAVTVVAQNAPLFLQNNTVSQALEGRVAGLDVINNTGGPGVNPQINIRGASSISNNNNPLYVIDGVAYDQNLSGNSNPLENIPITSIHEISVLKDANATSIYGCRGANGVIVITTSNKYGNFKTVKKPFSPRYTGVILNPRKTSSTREFYYPVYDSKELPEIRKDFRATIYWNPNINTNSAGEAKVEFYASDEITSFRAIAEGIGVNGCIGRKEDKYFAQLPFSMAVKFPAYVSFNDTVIMPLIVKNNTENPIKGHVKFSLPSSIVPIGELPRDIEIRANAAYTLSLPFAVTNVAGKDTITVSFQGDQYKDAFIQEVEVQPKGFPTKLSVSSKDKEKQCSFTISKPVNGSIRAQFNAFPDLLTDLLSGVESILREPYGCFEQTSSSTYPNIMVLQYINEAGLANKEISGKAIDLIKKGYNRLVGYETTQQGYEWFGHTPAHEGLTAYGLMEFVDMKGVYNGVDKSMIDRTLRWILSQRDGKGGFKRSTLALDQFGRASSDVTRAYIIYALSEADIEQVDAEYKIAFEEAIKSSDPYRMALVANAAYNFKKTKDGDQLLELLNDKLEKKNWDEVTIDHSITYSTGKSLAVETASLHTLALLKATGVYPLALSKNISYLISSRSYGGFGSTQGTILALKALKAYAKFAKQTADDGTIEIILNGQQAASYSYHKGDKGKISLTGLEKFLKEGQNTMVIRYLQTENPLSYTFDAEWTSLTPKTDAACNVAIETNLGSHHSKVGETVRLMAKLQNRTAKGLPMTMAVVGIPSGLSLQPWQLKEMQEKQKFDFYEVHKNYLVLYYRQMRPSEQRELNFDLKAEIAGSYQAPASSGYLYYTNEFKDWKDGEYIKIDSK